MRGPTFPVILVSDSSVMALASEEILLQVLSLSTDKAIRDGFYRRARLFDAAKQEFRVSHLSLSKAGLWLRRKRTIEDLQFERVQHLFDFAEVQETIVNALEADERHVDGIEQARSIEEIVALL